MRQWYHRSKISCLWCYVGAGLGSRVSSIHGFAHFWEEAWFYDHAEATRNSRNHSSPHEKKEEASCVHISPILHTGVWKGAIGPLRLHFVHLFSYSRNLAYHSGNCRLKGDYWMRCVWLVSMWWFGTIVNIVGWYEDWWGHQAEVYLLLQKLGGGARQRGVWTWSPPSRVVQDFQHWREWWLHCKKD